MDLRYEAFCFADPLFFDEQRDDGQAKDDFAAVLPSLGSEWRSGERGIWRSLSPADAVLPAQGWKIHVSAGMANAERVLLAVAAYCVEQRIAFKHLRSRSILLARNSKYAPRDGSGKLITIYPPDEESLQRVLSDLSAELQGEVGPYILSDLRYGEGPLYARYGGFAEQWVEADGTRVLAISKPDGTLVPDKRGPSFHVPDWVELPECLEPHLAARKGGDPAQFPYKVTKSLHFSNGGGVYLANRLADDREVVLKEARPHAGLDRDLVDAVARLEREHRILERLAGIPGIPEVYDRFQVWEHHFLAMQFVPGKPVGAWLARNYPLTRRDATEQDVAEYTERALALIGRVERLVAAVHERGVVFGDLHALNILVDDNNDDTVSLIDFELAAGIEEETKPALGAPGFRAQRDRTGFEIDEYALAALRLWLFLPLNTILELAPAKLASLVDFAERRFPLPEGYGRRILDVLSPRGDAEVRPAVTQLDEPKPDWAVVRKSIATAILASATPDRQDRLFPGDIQQFEVGGLGFGYGAAGVLHALHAAGEGRYPEHEQWLLDAVRRTPPSRPGFYDGTHGIAYVLENFGHHDRADELIAASRHLVEITTDHNLEGGLAGIGLNYLHFAGTRRDADFERTAVTIGERLGNALATDAGPLKFARAGLMSGWSGPALLFVRLFEATGDQAWLDLAAKAVERDLEECVPADDGSLQVRDGESRTLPYVGMGSAGVALAAEELAAHRPDADCLEKLPRLLDACRGEFVIHPGLMLGRAGLMATLSAEARRTGDPVALAAVDLHLSRFAWYALPYRDGLAFPGNQLLRLSMDLYTGGAGVLLALAATLDGHGAVLPFLSPGPRSSTAGG
ncbi:class III lanthionine synthetase LanKC [Amycolatopsis sp. YIM 10]|uniref:class III lanthionine synthetase LanKC n=1 Tax=Amycolatopsis sp. YIM 10 TaxID=2653857 RepID=UPI0012908502|nr:class III lanthionine synthetase LanKC [Amycolatopsis sp. YIM 10]QFU94309.1 Serine/threonine-protein kinase PknH [Amycolatopsis sp. YIM 10]